MNDMNQDFLMHQLRRSQSIKAYCAHCGNISYQMKTGECQRTKRDRSLSQTYALYQCDICNGVIFRSESIEHLEDAEETASRSASVERREIEQLWPPSITLPPEVPERVREIYEEALLVKSRSSSSFVVQIRRALEAVAKERNAPPRTALYAQIEWLVQNENLPTVFGEMGHLSRMIGNLGAHDAETDVQPQDADIADEFFRAIIEYIYIAPARVQRVRALLERR